jgi:hypothetical protein
MSDLVRPSSLFGGARAPSAGPSGVLGTVPNPPHEVMQLPVGTTLRGVVVGHDDHGHALVRTELGTLAVATKANLPLDSEVTLQIRSSGSQLHVLLMHSEAQPGGGQGAAAPNPPQVPPGQGGAAGTQGQPTTAPAPAQAPPGGHGVPPDLLSLGQTVRAVVQTPARPAGTTSSPGPSPIPVAAAVAAAPAGAGLSALAARLVPGSELHVRILSVQAPTPQASAPAPATARSGARPNTAAGAPGGAPGSPAAPTPITAQAPGQPAVPSPQAPAAGGTAPPGGVPATPAAQDGGGAATAPAQGDANPAPAALSRSPATPGSAGPAPTLLAHYAAPGARQTAGTGTAPSGGATVGGAAGNASTTAAPGAAVAAGGATGPNAPAPEAGLRFGATVSAVSHAGQPILQTPLGTLTLEIQAPLPSGSRVTLELPNGALPQPTSPGGAQAPAPLGTLAHAWPALDEALQALREVAAPGTGAIATPETVPQPGPRLASGLLFFLAALGAGDVNRWLGQQATQALKNAGREALLSRLGQDFGRLSRLAESPVGDWRLFFIPLLDGHQVQQLRMFLRHGQHGHDGGKGDEDGDSTRFVVELELSRLGELQLDGLVRNRRLDLILRSRAPLPEFMRREIVQIFHDTNGATGYEGSVGFQSSAEWGFMPIEAPPAAVSPGVVV